MRAHLAVGLALALALTSCAALGTHDAAPSPLAAGVPSPAAAAPEAVASPALTLVSVLGDSHSGWPGSWFLLSVANGTVPGVTPGVLSSHPGRTSRALLSWVDEANAQGGVVLVQAGTNDLLLGHISTAKAAQGVEALVDAVISEGAGKGVRAILVSVPPSATLGEATNQLNALLRSWTRAHGIGWLDVTSAASAPDGTWRAGLSDDGVHANDAGGRLMAEAARSGLPDLISAK